MKSKEDLKARTENFVKEIKQFCYLYNVNRFIMGDKANEEKEVEVFTVKSGVTVSSYKLKIKNTREAELAGKISSNIHFRFSHFINSQENLTVKDKQFVCKIVSEEILSWVKELELQSQNIDPIFINEFKSFQNVLSLFNANIYAPVKFLDYFNNIDEYQKIFDALISKRCFEKISNKNKEYKWTGISKLNSEPSALFKALVKSKKIDQHGKNYSFSEIARAFYNTYSCNIGISILQKTDRASDENVRTFLNIIQSIHR